MRQITITLTDELEDAIERYRQQYGDSPTLDVIARRLLEERVGVYRSGERKVRQVKPHPAIRFPTGPRLESIEHMVELSDGSSIAEAAIEDRR